MLARVDVGFTRKGVCVWGGKLETNKGSLRSVWVDQINNGNYALYHFHCAAFIPERCRVLKQLIVLEISCVY